MIENIKKGQIDEIVENNYGFNLVFVNICEGINEIKLRLQARLHRSTRKNLLSLLSYLYVTEKRNTKYLFPFPISIITNRLWYI